MLFKILFHDSLLQHIEYVRVPCAVQKGSCCLSILNIVVCVCYSQTSNLSPLFSPLLAISLFPMSVSLFLFCKYIHLYHSLRFHIQAVYFSFSGLLHLVWQSLGPSMLLQMALFHSLFVTELYLIVCVCVCVSHLLYAFICRGTFRLLSCPGYCKQCCNEHWGAYIFSD